MDFHQRRDVRFAARWSGPPLLLTAGCLAHRNHATRVLKLLGIYDLFADRIIYCDYSEPNFACKPEVEAYTKAMRRAGVPNEPTRCYLIDDSAHNCLTATTLGWRTVHVTPHNATTAAPLRIPVIHDLPSVVPEIFEPSFLEDLRKNGTLPALPPADLAGSKPSLLDGGADEVAQG